MNNRINRILFGATSTSMIVMILDPYLKGSSQQDIVGQSVIVFVICLVGWIALIPVDK